MDTAPENRAPYGDSYENNRLERPFTQDMTYIPDMDISAVSISEGDEWYFVSLGLIGNNPNNESDIRYMLELDTDLDSFGDYMIVAAPRIQSHGRLKISRSMQIPTRTPPGFPQQGLMLLLLEMDMTNSSAVHWKKLAMILILHGYGSTPVSLP